MNRIENIGVNKHSVIVHPLVLLSAVDHYNRMKLDRVMGVLLGEIGDEIHITNSFAIPFEENDDGWFYDTSYLQNMYELFHKVNSKEVIVGWYHTGPQMHKYDLEISKSFLKILKNPYLVIINVQSNSYDLPIQVFKLNKQQEFVHVHSEIQAEEAEEVGVEHLVRDARVEAAGSLKNHINIIKDALNVYYNCLNVIDKYIKQVIASEVQYNYEIIDSLQEILNSIPALPQNLDQNSSFVYFCELIKSTVGLCELKKNRFENEIVANK